MSYSMLSSVTKNSTKITKKILQVRHDFWKETSKPIYECHIGSFAFRKRGNYVSLTFIKNRKLNFRPPWRNSYKAGLPRWHHGSPRWSPGEAPVCAGISQCRPGYQRLAPDHPGLSRSSPGAITVCHGVAPVLPVF